MAAEVLLAVAAASMVVAEAASIVVAEVAPMVAEEEGAADLMETCRSATRKATLVRKPGHNRLPSLPPRHCFDLHQRFRFP